MTGGLGPRCAAMVLVLSCVWLPMAHGRQSVDDASQLLDDWQLEDALALAQPLLLESPNDGPSQLLAAEVLHQRGAHLQALALLRHLGEGASKSRLATVQPRIEGSAAYAASFHTLETPHFSIRYINKDEIVAHYAQPVLEAAYTHIGADLQFRPAERGEKIVVEIYPDARGLAMATGLTLKEIETSGTIAVCKFHRLMITSPLATADGYGWADTLAHEFIHLVISKKSHNSIPIWLHEGIAKFFESRWKGPAGGALTPYSEKLLAHAVRDDKFITFAQMHPSMAKLPSQEEAALAFAEVFSMVQYLTETYHTDAIARVLETAGRGVPIDKALHQVFGMDLAALEKAWKKSLKKRPLKDSPGARHQVIKLASQEDTKKEKPLEDIAQKVVHDYARLGELLQLRQKPQAAIVEYEKAMAKGGLQYSTLVNRLARAYVDVGRANEALALIDRDLSLFPEDTDGHLLAGRLRLKTGDVAAAKHHYEAVRLQNPFNPEVHAALAMLYKKEGDDAGAAMEQGFLAQSEAPRPSRTYELPPAAAGEATLAVVTPHWQPVTLDADATPVPTPAWQVPVKAGSHVVRLVAPGPQALQQEVNVGPGGRALVVLR